MRQKNRLYVSWVPADESVDCKVHHLVLLQIFIELELDRNVSWFYLSDSDLVVVIITTSISRLNHRFIADWS
jgi:hypothetical protein